MTEFAFSDRELRLAAAGARNAILAALPEPEDCATDFSDAFLEKMDTLLRLDKKREAKRKRLRRLAAAVLALIVGAAALVTFHPAARAAVQKWFRTTFEHTILYRYTEKQPDDALPEYTIGWLPEGYALVDSYEDPVCRYLVYQNEDERYLFIDFNAMFDGTLLEMDLESVSDYYYKQKTISGKHAELYIVSDFSDSSDLICFDEQTGVAIQISGFLSEDELIRIAENIQQK